MTWHHIQHWFSEIFFLSVLVSPLAFVLATAIGLASWLCGSDSGFLLAGFSWIFAMTVFPVWLRITCGPDTRIICQHCITSGKELQIQRSRIERRRGDDVRLIAPEHFSIVEERRLRLFRTSRSEAAGLRPPGIFQ